MNGSEKGEKSLLCMGNPSGPAGHLPCKAEEFCLRTDKLFACLISNLSQHINGGA